MTYQPGLPVTMLMTQNPKNAAQSCQQDSDIRSLAQDFDLTGSTNGKVEPGPLSASCIASPQTPATLSNLNTREVCIYLHLLYDQVQQAMVT